MTGTTVTITVTVIGSAKQLINPRGSQRLMGTKEETRHLQNSAKSVANHIRQLLLTIDKFVMHDASVCIISQ